MFLFLKNKDLGHYKNHITIDVSLFCRFVLDGSGFSGPRRGPEMSDCIKYLGDAIAAVIDCRCARFGTEHVREIHNGELVRKGDVEIFQIEGHTEACLARG